MERATTVMKTFHGNNRDATFSSYLRPEKPITCQPHHQSGLSRVVDDSTTELSIFDAHKYFNEVTNNEIQKASMSSSNSRVSPVVNIEGMNITAEATRYSSASSSVDGSYANLRNYRARSFHSATPTASSEASWNSQVGLLSHPQGAVSVSIRNPPNVVNHNNPNELNKKLRSSFSKPIGLLRRKCPCRGKKSVQVIEKCQKTPHPKAQTPSSPTPTPQRNHSLNLTTQINDTNPKTGVNMNPETETETETETPKNVIEIPITHNNKWVVDEIASSNFITNTMKSQRFQPHRVVTSVRVPFTEGFTFPVLHPPPPPPPPSISAKPHVVDIEDQPPRDSLEVFQPPHDTIATESPNPRAAVTDEDDAASDASSDLFEIESFSTTTNTQYSTSYPIIYHRSIRDSTYDDSSTSTTTNNNTNNGFFYRRSMDDGCYEPSEASIEWSVTTEKGCYEESIAGGEGVSTAGPAAAEKWKRKGGSSSGNGLLLVGCRGEKAVSVGPQPVKKCGGGTHFSSKHANVNLNLNVNNSDGGGESIDNSNSTKVVSVNKPPIGNSHSNTTSRRVSLNFST